MAIAFSSGYIDVRSSLGQIGAWSAGGWVELNSLATGQAIVSKTNGAPNFDQEGTVYFDTTSGKFKTQNSANSYSAATGTTTAATGVWYHVFAVYEGSGTKILRLYVNGSQEASVTKTLSVNTARSYDVQVGATDGFSVRSIKLNGSLADICHIEGYAASPAEVAALAKGVSSTVVLAGKGTSGARAIFPLVQNAVNLYGPIVAQAGLSAADHPRILLPKRRQIFLGAVGAAGISATLTQTLADATVSAASTLALKGTVSQTLANATTTATATLAIKGTTSQTLADATLSATSVLGSVVTGTLSATLDNATVAATGTLALAAVVTATLADASLSATATVLLKGSATITLGDCTIVAAGNGPVAALTDAEFRQMYDWTQYLYNNALTVGKFLALK